MNPQPDIVTSASEYIRTLFDTRLPSSLLYHNLHHAIEVAANTREIAYGMDVPAAERPLAEVAAWFHDAGYVDAYGGHEERSAGIVTAFLMHHGIAEKPRRVVAGSILATKIPQHPSTLFEQVLCDADLLNLGTREFFAKSELLRKERELYHGTPLPLVEWWRQTEHFLSAHRFHTEYARTTYGPRMAENLEALRERLAAHQRAPSA